MQNGFHVGDSHQVEPSLNRITGPAGSIRLEPKVMQVLVLLAAHAGQVVTKERLMQAVWPDAFVTDDVLTRAISELRRVFGDDARESRFIQTIPKSGYRLIAPVSPGGRARHVPTSNDAAAVDDRASIAVLPFEHLGGPEREYLTDGLTEEISASLGQIDPEHLTVKGRTSTRRYKNTSKSLAEIGQELGVEYLLEGSVRAESSRLRVTSKLIRARDQVQIWAESYESEPGSMLELQRELSAAIARQVRLRLSPDRLTALALRHTRNAEAYDLYLRGRHLWNQLTPETNRRAIESYQRATQLDPEFALACAGLADIYSASPINSDVPPRDVSAQARDAAARAVASGADLAETQTALGTVHYWLDWDWPAAEAAYRKAIAVDPGFSQAHRVLGIVLQGWAGMTRPARRCSTRENLTRTTRCSLPLRIRAVGGTGLLVSARTGTTGNRHRSVVLDWLLPARDGLRAAGEERAGARRAGEGRGLEWQQQDVVAAGIHPGEIGAHERRRKKCCVR